MSDSGRLSNRVAVVTGAPKGIGALIAKHLASSGATVVVSYATSRSGAEKTVATPLGRVGQPEDIARAVVFLASSDASWITGQLLNVSGETTF